MHHVHIAARTGALRSPFRHAVAASLFWVIAALGLFVDSARAQGTVNLVADLNTGPNSGIDGGLDRFKAAVFFGGRTVFTMRTPEHGTELWETDGTALGTRMLADLCPGQCSSLESAPNFYAEGSSLYFAANDGRHGRELWRLDVATGAQPVMVLDLNPGADGSNPGNFTRLSFSINGSSVTRTFFSAARADVGQELWRLGASSSVTLELDLLAGTVSGSPSDIQVCSTGQVCLLARTVDGVNDVRLLTYSSTTQVPIGATGVGGLNISGTGRSVADLQSLGPNTFVLIRDNVALDELRAFGNSAASSTLLRSFGNANGLLTPNVSLFRMFLTADSQLFVSDGTVAGTLSISSASPANLVSLGNRVLLTANTAASGRELFSSDGTAAGTVLLKELVPGADGMPNSSTDFFMGRSANNLRMFLGFINPALGVAGQTQLWISDGTAAGTVEISGNAITDPGSMVLYPSAGTSALIGYNPSQFGNGGEPYFTQGSAASTVALGNFIGDTGDSFASPIAVFNQRLFVNAFRGGSSSETLAFPLTAGAPGAPTPFLRFFQAIGEFFGRLWIDTNAGLQATDGTLAGTLDLSSIRARSADSGCYAQRNGRVYFYADQGSFDDVEIFKSDGTLAGTVAVTELSTPEQRRMDSFCFDDGFTQLATVGDKLMFVADTGSSGLELFALDASDNAALVLDIRSGSNGGQVRDLRTLRDRPGLPEVAVFRADDGIFGSEPWVTGGTAQTTQRLLDINPGPGTSEPREFVAAGPRMFFTAFSPSSGRELYVTDGTPAGTRLVIDLFAGSGSGLSAQQQQRPYLFANGRLYFSGTSSSRPNCVLFETDGTAAGTRCAYDDSTTTLRSIARDPVATANGALVFSAYRSAPVNDGEELRVLFNRQLLNFGGADLAPGPAGSRPSDLLAVGDDVYFRADDGVLGAELYRLQLDDLNRVFADGFE
jgi:ELWxxDGT repeat protein